MKLSGRFILISLLLSCNFAFGEIAEDFYKAFVTEKDDRPLFKNLFGHYELNYLYDSTKYDKTLLVRNDENPAKITACRNDDSCQLFTYAYSNNTDLKELEEKDLKDTPIAKMETKSIQCEHFPEKKAFQCVAIGKSYAKLVQKKAYEEILCHNPTFKVIESSNLKSLIKENSEKLLHKSLIYEKKSKDNLMKEIAYVYAGEKLCEDIEGITPDFETACPDTSKSECNNEFTVPNDDSKYYCLFVESESRVKCAWEKQAVEENGESLTERNGSDDTVDGDNVTEGNGPDEIVDGDNVTKGNVPDDTVGGDNVTEGKGSDDTVGGDNVTEGKGSDDNVGGSDEESDQESTYESVVYDDTASEIESISNENPQRSTDELGPMQNEPSGGIRAMSIVALIALAQLIPLLNNV